MSNNSFGMGSSIFDVFFDFPILLILIVVFGIEPIEPKALYITSYYFFINFVKVIDFKSIGGKRGLINFVVKQYYAGELKCQN